MAAAVAAFAPMSNSCISVSRPALNICGNLAAFRPWRRYKDMPKARFVSCRGKQLFESRAKLLRR